MKKIVKLSLVSAMGALMFVGCNPTNSAKPQSHDAKTAQNTYIEHTLTQEKVSHRITTAAKENGWRITDFKNNTLIAEKSVENTTTAITVNFDKESFSLNPKNAELQTIIEDALNAKSKSH